MAALAITDPIYDTQIRYFSDNDIVPQEYQHELIYWRDNFRQGYFAIGDIANSLIQQIADSSTPITHDRVYQAIGNFIGKSGRTVRYYAEVAAYYPADVRQYYEMLPFSHFVFAKQYGNWARVLSLAMENPQLSVDALRVRLLSAGCAPVTDDAVCASEGLKNNYTDATVGVSFLSAAPPKTRILSVINFIAGIRDQANGLFRVLRQADRLEPEMEDTIRQIQDAVEVLLKQVDKMKKDGKL